MNVKTVDENVCGEIWRKSTVAVPAVGFLSGESLLMCSMEKSAGIVQDEGS